MSKPKRPTTKVRDIAIDGGRAMGAEVRDSDPDGNVTVHAVNLTQRRADALHYVGAITDEQHLAATKFRDIWERGRLMADLRAGRMQHMANSEAGYKAAWAWKRHTKTMEYLGIGKAHILQAVILHDESPALLVARHMSTPLGRLESALDRLVKWGERGMLDTDDG